MNPEGTDGEPGDAAHDTVTLIDRQFTNVVPIDTAYMTSSN